MRSRPNPYADGTAMPRMIAPNNRPICDRSIRWISNCRRETGAGNRNSTSASEKSSRPLSKGASQLTTVTTRSEMPASAGPAATSAGPAARAGSPVPRARAESRAADERALRSRPKNEKYIYAAPTMAPMK